MGCTSGASGGGAGKFGTKGRNAGTAGESEKISYKVFARLSNLKEESGTRQEMKKQLETIPDNTTFYVADVYKGQVRGVLEITKNSNDDYTVGDQPKTARDTVRLMRSTKGKVMQNEPDTSSHVKITGKQGKSIEGLKYASGTYDIQKNIGNSNYRKVEVSGKITTYDGTQYGITKSGSTYAITHIPTGLLLASNVSSMNNVSKTIKEKHNQMVKGRKSYVDGAEKRFKSIIRQ